MIGPPGKLQQVLLNLLINAGRRREGRRRIRRCSRANRRADGRVVVEVMDNGAGISEEDLPRIFDPFFTTKGRGKGTGLGLSVTYGIVQEHGGRIEAENSPDGPDCVFRVELPARPELRPFPDGGDMTIESRPNNDRGGPGHRRRTGRRRCAAHVSAGQAGVPDRRRGRTRRGAGSPARVGAVSGTSCCST